MKPFFLRRAVLDDSSVEASAFFSSAPRVLRASPPASLPLSLWSALADHDVLGPSGAGGVFSLLPPP